MGRENRGRPAYTQPSRRARRAAVSLGFGYYAARPRGRGSGQFPNVRLGIASGLVVVGDLIGAGAAQERGVVGETPNLAARLQAVAQPGTLVIAESTRRQIGALFEWCQHLPSTLMSCR